MQDAAAALPARLLNAQPGETIADLCAAPGGKTAQLAATGATVIAVDRSAKRLERLTANMERLKLSVETRAIDALTMPDAHYDAILLDAPCTATGTIRRHPDVGWTKDGDDLEKLVSLQTRLLDKAVSLLRSGGRLIYCTCSLEPEEGEDQITALLARHPDLIRAPFTANDLPAFDSELKAALTDLGEVRTLPFMLPHSEPRLAGIDGFFAARLIKP